MISVSPRTSPSKAPWQRWVDPPTTSLQRYSYRSIINKSIFGQWELCCILCYLEKYHSLEETRGKLFKMLSEVSSTSTIKHSKMCLMGARIWLTCAWSRTSLRESQLLMLSSTLGLLVNLNKGSRLVPLEEVSQALLSKVLMRSSSNPRSRRLHWII